MMNSRLRLHIAMDSKIVNTHPIHSRSGVLYQISIDRDLSMAEIKDETGCVVFQMAGNTKLSNMLRVLVNYLAQSLDCEFSDFVEGYNDDNLVLTAPTAQTLTFTPTPTTGQFKLQYAGGPKTGFMQWNVTAAQMEAELRLITGLDELCVSGSMATTLIISFGGVLVPGLLVVTDSTLDGTAEINHLIATQIAFTTQPSSSVEGVVFATQPVVTIKDAAGHTVTSGPDATASVSIALQSGTGALTGTTSMNAVAGVANFVGKGLKVSLAGNKVLRATKASTVGIGGTIARTADTSTLVITTAAAGPTLPSLGTAANYRILAKSGITTTGVTSITGDLGVSPAAASSITGFGLVLDGSNTFSTSSLVTGNIYAADYASPTPANLTTAVNNMQTAYTNTAGVAADVTELGSGNISGMSLAAGTYKWSTGLIINGTLTLTGGAADTYIFQVAGTMDIGPSTAATIVLSGGALPQNIYWQVAGATTIYPSSVMKGVILSATNVAMQSGATLNGRLLVQTAATLIGNTITA